ncbi:MAG: lipocalin-like domain-containing protein [Xanthobacteraceae bacterium]
MSEQSQSAAQRLIGSWRYVGSTLDGKSQRERGASPKGIIIYDVHGHMACHVAPDHNVPRAGKEPTGEEAIAALADHIAYFGTYSVDERGRTVTHHRQGSVQPGDKGDVVRGYEFVGDRLILRPVGTTREVIWERIK